MSNETTKDSVARRLHDLLEAIRKTPGNPERHYGEVVRLCAELVNAESCSIWLWDRSNHRLVLAGACGYGHGDRAHRKLKDLPNVNYDPGENGLLEGVTGRVFETGEADSAENRRNKPKEEGHKGANYDALWEEPHDDQCHSWYQFRIEALSRIGVMKIENKRKDDGEIDTVNGFTSDDKSILEILANSAVPIIYWSTELDTMIERSKRGGPATDLEYTSDIYSVFSKHILESIVGMKSTREAGLHKAIKKFAMRIQREGDNIRCEYVGMCRDHLSEIIESLGLPRELAEFLVPLADYQAILFQLPSYREHFVHQLNVFLIGYFVLNTITPELFASFGKALVIHGEASSSGPDETRQVFQTWFLASMLHDTGYPLGKAGDWTRTFVGKMFGLEDGPKPSPVNVTETLAARLMRYGAFDWLERLGMYLSKEYPMPAKRFSDLRRKIIDEFIEHLRDDIVAALVVIRAGEKLDITKRVIASAATTIAAHDHLLWDSLQLIAFEQHPYAFLLYYCDSAQEHGRRRSSAHIQDSGPHRDDWVVTETRVVVEERSVGCGSILTELTYSKEPGNWSEKVWPGIKAGGAKFLGPPGWKCEIVYRLESGTELERVTFYSCSS